MRHGAKGLIGLAWLGGLVAAVAPANAADLTFWSWRQEDRAVYQDLIKDFTAQNPGTTVKFETFEVTAYNTILSTALAGGKGPDIVHVRAYGNFETFAKANYLLPLDKTSVPELANFGDAALASETLRADGKVYAVPFAQQTMLLLCNKALFAKAGITPPTSWDELIAAAKALKAKGILPFANGVATSWQNEVMLGVFGPSLYGKAFNDDLAAGKATFEDPRFVGALQKLADLAPYMPDGFTGIDYASAQQLFVGEQAAMFAGGSYEIANFKQQNPKLDIDVIPGPTVDPAAPHYVSLYFDGGYAVNAASPAKDQALKFLRFAASQKFGQTLVDRLKNITPIKGTPISDPLLAKVAKLDDSALPYVMLVYFRYQEPTGSALIQAALQKMFAGKQTPAEVGAEVTRGIAAYYPPFKKG